MTRKTRRWKYKNLTFLALSLLVFFFLADTEAVHALLRYIGSYGYLGAAITGIFFVSTFTVAPAYFVLFELAQNFNPFLIAICAGAGGVIGDLLILRFLRDGVFKEIRPLLKRFRGSYIGALFRTPYFAWFAPVLGAIIIASPFPDEIGISLMGISRIKTWQFVALTFVLDTAGVLFIVVLARGI
jgi:hypothetical protein